MSTIKETAKDILAKLRAVFEDSVPPAPPAAPMVPPVGTPYTLQDGSQISIVQAGDTPATGDLVTIAGAPAPANTYTLQDGSSLTTDATGAITVYTATAPVTTDIPAAAAAPPAAKPVVPAVAAPAAPKFELTPEGAAAMFASFATGTPDERIANLEVVCKALMENCFGWQLREAQQKATADQAILVYQSELKTAQAAMNSQKTVIDTQEIKLKGLFELVEKLVEIPTGDPVTLTGAKKDKFEKAKSKEDKFQKIADALKELREEKNK